jgi:hypothetical protein
VDAFGVVCECLDGLLVVGDVLLDGVNLRADLSVLRLNVSNWKKTENKLQNK